MATLIEDRRFDPLREALRPVGDLERVLARVPLRSARPRDLVHLRGALAAVPEVRATLAGLDDPHLGALLSRTLAFPDLQDHLTRAVVEAPPATVRDGGVIAVPVESLRAILADACAASSSSRPPRSATWCTTARR